MSGNSDSNSFDSGNFLTDTITLTAVSKAVSFNYAIRTNPNLTTSSRDYVRPLRPRIWIMSRDASILYHYYDAFTPTYSDIKITKVDITLGESSAGEARITIEDSSGVIDTTKVGLGNKILIETGKTSDQYSPIFSGYCRKMRTDRPDTGNLSYLMTCHGTQIRFNERMTNFVKTAQRQNIDSVDPDQDDVSQRASELVKDLVRDTDHLPLGEPTEGQLKVDQVANISEVIPSIQELLQDWSRVMNVIADTTGAIWGVDANDSVFFRYPADNISGIIIKDQYDPNDRSDRTCYFTGPWSFEDSIDKSDGFANRIYGKGSSIQQTTISGTSNSLSFTSLFSKAIAQQFLPTSANFVNLNLTLLLSKVGNPEQTSDGLVHGQIILDDSTNPNNPTGSAVAAFAIHMSDILTTPTPIFQMHLLPFVPNLQMGQKYWIVLYQVGPDDNNTIRWHHNDDHVTSAFSATGDPGDRNLSADVERIWAVSPSGPTYTYVIRETQVHTTEASDPESIARYGVIEDVQDATWIQENVTMDKYLSARLAFSAKVKRVYDVQSVTPCDIPIVPGSLVEIIDSQSGITASNPVMAEIVEVVYSFDTAHNAVGTNSIGIRPIGFVDSGGFLKHKTDNSIEIFGGESLTPETGFPHIVYRYYHFPYQILSGIVPGNPPPPPNPGDPPCLTGTHYDATLLRCVDDTPPPPVDADPFGIPKLYPTTKTNSVGGVIGREWFSTTWNNKKVRTLKVVGDKDPYDPETFFSGNGHVTIDGLKGYAVFNGDLPQLHIFDIKKVKKWLNVELTFYAMRVSESAHNASAGFSAGVRSNHYNSTSCPCNGLSYYGDMKYDGRVVFFKEIIHNHPNGSVIPEPQPITTNWWSQTAPDHTVPSDMWVGYKLVCRTKTSTNTVQLELWRDLEGGDGTDGSAGNWQKLIVYEDKGGWKNPKLTVAQIKAACGMSGCFDKPATTDPIILRPGFDAFIINQSVSEARYKWFSIRELDPLP